MIIVMIKQGYSEVIFETELYPDAELLISTVLGLADNRTSIVVTTTEKSEASYLQEEKDKLEEELRKCQNKLHEIRTKLDTYERKVEGK